MVETGGGCGARAQVARLRNSGSVRVAAVKIRSESQQRKDREAAGIQCALRATTRAFSMLSTSAAKA